MAKKINKLDNFKKLLVDINSERKKLLNLRFQKATGQLEKTAQIRKIKKNIARLNTKLNQDKGFENA